MVFEKYLATGSIPRDSKLFSVQTTNSIWKIFRNKMVNSQETKFIGPWIQKTLSRQHRPLPIFGHRNPTRSTLRRIPFDTGPTFRPAPLPDNFQQFQVVDQQ